MHYLFNSSGLVTLHWSSDVRKKTGWYYLATLQRTLGEYVLDGIVADGPNVYHYEYVVPGTGRRAAVLWARDGERDGGYTARYQGPAGTLVEPVHGSTSGTVTPTNGDLTLAERPVFVLYEGQAPPFEPPPAETTPEPAGPCGRLVNCSFENGLSGWSQRIGLEDFNRVGWWPVHGGSRSYHVSGDQSGPYILQDVVAAPGERLDLRGWLYVSEARPGMNVLIDLTPKSRWGGQLTSDDAPVWRYVVSSTTDGWVRLDTSVVMPAGTGLLRLAVRSEPVRGTVYLDDLYLDRSTAPSMPTPSATPTASVAPTATGTTATPTPSPSATVTATSTVTATATRSPTPTSTSTPTPTPTATPAQ